MGFGPVQGRLDLQNQRFPVREPADLKTEQFHFQTHLPLNISVSLRVPEGSLAGFFGRRDMSLEMVCGDDFSCTLMCGAGPAI